MITPSLVRQSAKALAADEESLTEDTIALDVVGVLQPATLESWRTIAEAIEASGIGSLRALNASDDPIDLRSATVDSVQGTVRIKILKHPTPTTFYFFSAKGMVTLLSDPELISKARRILVAGDFEEFGTVSCRFQPWREMVQDETTPDPLASVVPRRLVRDMIGGRVPLSIGPFLLSNAQPAASEVFEAWKSIAIQQLLRTLVNEVWTEGGQESIQLSGPRTHRLLAGLDGSLDLKALQPATDAARWVYDSGRDIETRHTLLTYELARDWPGETSWSEGFAAQAPRALDAAKTSFQSYIREISKDTLKSLSDLRKTLSEEVGKVSAQTRDLLSTLWRDFVVAVTAALARIALVLADKPAADSFITRGMLFATAFFLGASLILTIRSNTRFMRIAEDSRIVWRTKLYGFLPAADLDNLLDKPLKESTETYKSAKYWVIWLYAALIIILLLAGAWPSLHQNTQAPKSVDSAPARVPGASPSPTVATPKTPLNSPTPHVP